MAKCFHSITLFVRNDLCFLGLLTIRLQKMRLSAWDYLGLMEKLRLFGQNSLLPECHPGVWRAYLDLYRAFIGDPKDMEIVSTENGLGFSLDPLTGDDLYRWALLNPVSHPHIPFSADTIVDHAEDIGRTFREEGIDHFCILTDSFEFPEAASLSSRNHFGWLNSPQALIHDRFEDYAVSLTAPRRKQMRRLYRSYDEDKGFRFDFSDRPPDAAETDFIDGHTRRHWGEAWEYALAQFLWQIAAAGTIPSCARFMRVYDRDRLLYINGYILRGDTLYSQCTCRNMDTFHSGLGTLIDFKAIEVLSGNADIHIVDPTCGAALFHQETISVAKREIVNTNRQRPFLCMGARDNINQTLGGFIPPFYDNVCGWQRTDIPFLTGKGL